MLSDYKPVEALLNLHRSRRSGILRFQKDTIKKQIVLTEGRVVFAESNVAEEHLARVMVSMGLLNRSDLAEIASIMKKGKTSEEAALSITGNNRDLLEKARRAQAIRILASLLALQTCKMGLYAGTDLNNRLTLDLGVPELVLEAARSAASSRLVSANLLLQELSLETGLDAGPFCLNSTESLAYDLICHQANPADRVSLFPPGKEALEQSLSVLSILGLIKSPTPAITKSGVPVQNETEISIQQLEDMLSRVDGSNAHAILSVKDDATSNEIQAAYHELALRFHPDRFQSKEFPAEVHSKAERVFTCIKEAYQKLKDTVARAPYEEQKVRTTAAVSAPVRTSSAEEAESLFRQGRVFLVRGEFEKAAENLKTAVWLCPEKAAYHHYLGVAESANPRFRRSAEQHFLKSIELDFTSVESRIALARLYVQVNLNRKAEQLLMQVLDMDPGNAEALKLLEVTGQSDSKLSGRHKHSLLR